MEPTSPINLDFHVILMRVRYNKRLVFAISIGVFLAFVFSLTPAFAIHQSEALSWQLVVISSDSGCSNYLYHIAQRYNEITRYYFELYELPNQHHPPQCYPEYKYENEYETPEDLDLIILVYDKNKGREELNNNDLGGFYSHVGDSWTHNHAIVFCDCPNFKFSHPEWILTHELSHFILYYLGYERSIVEDLVHNVDAKSDYCVEEYYHDYCKGLRMRINTEHYSTTVMPPYEPAIGSGFASNDQETKKTIDSPLQTQSMKLIAKWWGQGKLTDEDYLEGINTILNNRHNTTARDSPMFSAESPNIVFTDPPKQKKNNIELHTESLGFSSPKTSKILEMHPFKEAYNETNEDKIPKWITTRTDWWLNGKIDDRDYFAGMEHFLKTKKSNKLNTQESYEKATIQTISIPKYKQIDMVQIKGKVQNYMRGDPIAITISDPDDSEESREITAKKTGEYFTQIMIDHTSEPGEYEVQVMYNSDTVKSFVFELVASETGKDLENFSVSQKGFSKAKVGIASSTTTK